MKYFSSPDNTFDSDVIAYDIKCVTTFSYGGVKLLHVANISSLAVKDLVLMMHFVMRKYGSLSGR